MQLLISILLALLFWALMYIAYLGISARRLPPRQELKPRSPAKAAPAPLKSDEIHSLLSWNIGFGAYEKSFSFFMDGGRYGRAVDSNRLLLNMGHIGEYLTKHPAELHLFQEVDTASDRSWRLDEVRLLRSMPGMIRSASCFADNYRSGYIFWPLYGPMGKCRSGLLSLSCFGIRSAERLRLPVDPFPLSLTDLDRCLLKSRIPTEGGRELVLYNLHLSAYSRSSSLEVLYCACAIYSSES